MGLTSKVASLSQHGIPLALSLTTWAANDTDPPRLTQLTLTEEGDPGEVAEITPEHLRAVADLLPQILATDHFTGAWAEQTQTWQEIPHQWSWGVYLTLIPPRPDGTDAFYSALARVYRDATDVLRSEKPNELIGRANNVPVPTVARWVREARRRGLLEPAPMRGKAGTK